MRPEERQAERKSALIEPATGGGRCECSLDTASVVLLAVLVDSLRLHKRPGLIFKTTNVKTARLYICPKLNLC